MEGNIKNEMRPVEKAYQKYDGIRVETNILSEEEQNVLARLEEASDALWADRKEVDFAYEKIKEFLPTKKTETGNEIPLSFAEIKSLQESGSLSEMTESVIRTKLQEKYSGRELERKVRNVGRKLKRLLEKGIVAHTESEQKDNLEERIKQYSEAKSEKEKENIWKQMPAEMKLLTRYRRFRLKELGLGKRALFKAEEEIRACNDELSTAYEDGGVDAVREVREDLKKALQKYNEILYSSPEVYYWQMLSQLDEWKDILDSNGGIVETPYVKEQIVAMKNILDGSRPAFVHGELGSGKTELAKLMCRKEYSQKHLERWEQKNPKPEHPGEIDDWNARREKEKEPFLLSGHKNMDTSSVLGGRGMEATQAPSPEEQVRETEEGVRKLEQDQEEAGQVCTEEMKEGMRNAYRDKFKNFVEVKEVLGMFYEAMKQGRPIIIDEMNAIPHSILIALNEYLKAKPGNIIHPMIPGAQSFPVQEGFAVIATGNWKPEDGKAYVGRQQLDAAFLSRFGLVHYDYLPQRVKGETQKTDDESQRKEKAENELFILLATHILDKDTLGADVPEGTFEKLRSLAQVARHIQDVFAETEKDIFHDPITQEDVPAKNVLGENALSIRHLIPIIERWKRDGFSKELDEYVFMDFVERSKGARPKEKAYLYKTIQGMSDKQIFATEKEWPDANSPEGMRKMTEIGLGEKFTLQGGKQSLENFGQPPELRYYSPQEVVTEIFGPAPGRKKIDKSLFEMQDDGGMEVPPEDQIEEERNYFKVLEEIEAMAKRMANEGYEMTPEERDVFSGFEKMTEKI